MRSGSNKSIGGKIMEYSVRGRLAGGACNVMKGLLGLHVIAGGLLSTADVQLVLHNRALAGIIWSTVLFILAIMALVGRDDMDQSGKRAANSCMFWGGVSLIWHFLGLIQNGMLGQSNLMLDICMTVQLVSVLLVYIFCSGDPVWSVLLGIGCGAGMTFLWGWMISAGWNGWLILAVLLGVLILGSVLIQLLRQYPPKEGGLEEGVSDRITGNIVTGLLGAALIWAAVSVFFPMMEGATVHKSVQVNQADGSKSAVLIHVEWGESAEWKLPEFLNKRLRRSECSEYLLVEDKASLLDWKIAELRSTEWIDLPSHSELHHISEMTLVWLSWEDEDTVRVDDALIDVH